MYLKNLRIDVKAPERANRIAYTEAVITNCLVLWCIEYTGQKSTSTSYTDGTLRTLTDTAVKTINNLNEKRAITEWTEDTIRFLINSLIYKIDKLKLETKEEQFDKIGYYNSILDAIKEARKDL